MNRYPYGRDPGDENDYLVDIHAARARAEGITREEAKALFYAEAFRLDVIPEAPCGLRHEGPCNIACGY